MPFIEAHKFLISIPARPVSACMHFRLVIRLREEICAMGVPQYAIFPARGHHQYCNTSLILRTPESGWLRDIFDHFHRNREEFMDVGGRECLRYGPQSSNWAIAVLLYEIFICWCAFNTQ